MGWMQPIELASFDYLLRLQPTTEIDPRLLIVGISESDIQQLQQWPISDQVLADALAQLQQHRPHVIGLDIYRDIPQKTGEKALQEQFQATNLVTIESYNAVPAPPTVPRERVGFNDILLDVDGVVRRSLLFAAVQGQSFYSFPLQLSLTYLSHDQSPLEIKTTDRGIHIGPHFFPTLSAHSGFYQRLDDRGYQILLRYRPAKPMARQITLTQVLEGEFQSEWVKNKIVLIGATADSAKDNYLTPYTVTYEANAYEPGVIIHAHTVSQILSVILDQEPLIWSFSNPIEILSIFVLAYLGLWLHLKLQSITQKMILNTLLIIGIFGSGYLAFIISSLCVPVIPMALAVFSGFVSAGLYQTLELQKLSNEDPLTRLANRRIFDQTLQQEWYRALRSQHHIALILCDVDYFKSYNDTYGHLQGDHCLSQVGKALKAATRRSKALIARYGGEEFVILLPHHSPPEALKVAEAVHKQIRLLKLPHQGSSVSEHITLSLGVTGVIPTMDLPPNSLVRFADLGLYTAKRKGRNRAILHLPDSSPNHP